MKKKYIVTLTAEAEAGVRMSVDPEIAYHLRELEIAADPESPHYAMPGILAGDQAILDIGCGIGQTLVAIGAQPGRRLVGLDVGLKCLNYGRQRFGHITFVNGTAERLPFADGCFDLVISRVSLPYTNIPVALAEIERVLKGDGRAWFTLHSFSKAVGHLIQALRKCAPKDAIYRSYVIGNGLGFHLLGRQFRFFPKRKYESFQTMSGMARAMRKAGFADIRVGREGKQFICTARTGRTSKA
jgi:ubiquinone/menaquinone biosynthesis C-methylase UbiE